MGWAKWVRWSEAVDWSFLFIYFIHLLTFTHGSLSRKVSFSKALCNLIKFICMLLGNQWSGDHHFYFPIRTEKGKWYPLHHKFLSSQSTRDKNVIWLTFPPLAPTHPMHVPGLDATQVSKWACSIRNYWYSYGGSERGFSKPKMITNIKFIAKWVG